LLEGWLSLANKARRNLPELRSAIFENRGHGAAVRRENDFSDGTGTEKPKRSEPRDGPGRQGVAVSIQVRRLSEGGAESE
jgi:hypothetical protein